MPRRILIGLLAVAIACAIVSAGHAFGRYLAERDGAAETQAGPGS